MTGLDFDFEDTTSTPAQAPASAVDVLRGLIAKRSGGESRPEQERMVEAVEKAIKTRRHLVAQAGTGTGKTLGYLVPAIVAGEPVVVSTATKQLSEQILREDLPTLSRLLPELGARPFTSALLKGRKNYLCQQKVATLLDLDNEAPGGASDEAINEALFDVETQEKAASKRPSKEDLTALNNVIKWADETVTGDRTDAPAVPDQVWDQVSTDSAGCPGAKACPFGEVCFAERARAAAKEAQVVVTNHAQVAQDLRSPVPILGDYTVLVTDEVHELESYLSSAWGHELSPNAAKHAIALATRKLPRTKDGDVAKEIAKTVVGNFEALAEVLAETEGGLLPEVPERIGTLMLNISDSLLTVAQVLNKAGERSDGQTAAEFKGAAGKVTEVVETIIAILSANGEDSVRWLEAAQGRRAAILKVAPLWVGPQLMTLLGDKTLIATSATITVGGSFDPMVRTLALGERVPGEDGSIEPRGFDTIDVGSPFDYDKQAILYIPGTDFPEPTGRDRIAHTEAVLDEMAALVKAAGGRTLALFTTKKAAEEAATYLRTQVGTPVLAQGEAPPAQLITEFAEVEEATLCATMGFWHGVNVPGPSLSCVVMDKIPFAPMDDPLMQARRAAVENAGGNGFHEVYVATASVMLAQGTGRLVRTATDKGVVAILDTRLRTKKSYGPTMIRSLPPMRQFTDLAVVEAALTRLTGGTPDSVKPPVASAGGRRATGGREPKPRRAAPSRTTTRSLARGKKTP